MDMLTLAVRQLLLFAHLIAFAFALVTVLREDVALLKASRIDASHLAAASHNIVLLLTLLWLTGVALIGLDIGFDVNALIAKPKLAAKVTVAVLLTLNGMLLHRLAFPLLTADEPSPAKAAVVGSILGAVSSVTWVYVSFLGASRLIAPAMTFSRFIGLYLLSVMVGVAMSMFVVRPRLERALGAGVRSYAVPHADAAESLRAPDVETIDPVLTPPRG